jgi:hypothetical protein
MLSTASSSSVSHSSSISDWSTIKCSRDYTTTTTVCKQVGGFQVMWDVLCYSILSLVYYNSIIFTLLLSFSEF